MARVVSSRKDKGVLKDISLKNFAKMIKADNLNSYEGTKMHPKGTYVYTTRIEINEPIKWYREDASATEQECARETALKSVLTQLVESEGMMGGERVKAKGFCLRIFIRQIAYQT